MGLFPLLILSVPPPRTPPLSWRRKRFFFDARATSFHWMAPSFLSYAQLGTSEVLCSFLGAFPLFLPIFCFGLPF